jgi:hypothetical protein
MERLVATITDGAKVIAADVEVTIILTSVNRLGGWRGFFADMGAVKMKVGDGPYLMTVKDGRSGRIVVSNVSQSFQGRSSTLIEFDGTGSFG